MEGPVSQPAYRFEIKYATASLDRSPSRALSVVRVWYPEPGGACSTSWQPSRR